ncbi:hypothetical protein BWI97_21210 [Siphonobacter sp. BAB-5405]|uniref:toll/interleukin-1 receptor domain-containing protein n=1 Tax=Siphonobacter sp. BAB-5405 TaxID=1864825 RepID=UPI000C80DECC|nr:toll/interleukin-1 receptor domain-containing protein [Siphonobacter sp. BAB-5405]PMD91636.1 hypothetical protein BWI97_21210 [Siphonobacter sp. BAB-5405]
MNIFLSYTTHENEVTIELLQDLKEQISFFGKVFIDLIDNDSFDKQERVVKELHQADLVVLINTPNALKSNWVKFELQTATILEIPVLYLNIFEIYPTIADIRIENDV